MHKNRRNNSVIKRKPQFHKALIFRSLAVAISVLMAFLIIELVLHALWRAPRLPVPVNALRNDESTYIMLVANYDGYLNTPYHRTRFQTNSHGLRDIERSNGKPAGTYRILALGDSYVEGHGVEFEETFLRISENNINDNCDEYKVDIIKAGVGGWGPANEFCYLSDKGNLFEPDMVIVFFYTGNDYADAENPDRFAAYRGIRIERPYLNSINPRTEIKITLRKHVYLYGWLVDFMRGILLSPEIRFEEDYDMMEMCRTGPRNQSLTAVEETIIKFKTYCRDNKIMLRFVILPHRLQVESGRAELISNMLNASLDQFDLDRPSKEVGKILDNHEIPYLDTTAFLRNESKTGGHVGMGGDSHYNPRVHHQLSKPISDYLLDMNPIPCMH